MEYIFYILGVLCIISTMFSILNFNPVHALLYLIVSILSISGIFFVLGGIFAAVLEVIVYAGAIMVLFVFVIMMLNLGNSIVQQERKWLHSIYWNKIIFLFILFYISIFYVFSFFKNINIVSVVINIKTIGDYLFGPYILIVELSSILLLSVLIVILHLGKEHNKENK